MKEYVLGFAFNESGSLVCLILKNRPEWQKGNLNGIGGKLEPTDDSIETAMIREFKEETGLDTTTSDWRYFACMDFIYDVMGGSAKVHCFKMFSDKIKECQTMEDEEVVLIDVNALKFKKTISHINTLIPMALDESISFCKFNMN